MLVGKTGRAHRALESLERGRQEHRLLQQAKRSPIVLGARFQAPHHQPLEVGDCLVTTPQLVVQAQNFHDMAWSDLERRGGAVCGGRPHRFAEEDLTGELGQQRRHAFEPLREGAIEVDARHQLG